jgi:hypothetical protein
VAAKEVVNTRLADGGGVALGEMGEFVTRDAPAHSQSGMPTFALPCPVIHSRLIPDVSHPGHG